MSRSVIALSAFVFAALFAGAANSQSIIPSQVQFTGAATSDIASGDFDADGDVDLAVTVRDMGVVQILLNDGMGGFGNGSTIPVGTTPAALLAARLDAGTTIDLAVAVLGEDRVAILLGDGDGTFGNPAKFDTGDAPGDIVAADFDKDALLDLITVDTSGNTTSVLLNNGNGTFQAPLTNAVGRDPKKVAVGDWDDNGNLDIATTIGDEDKIDVQLGNGNGTFGNIVSIAVGRDPWAIVAVDLDGDGLDDLAVTNATNDSISILLNSANASLFTVVDTVDTGNRPEGIVVADFDGDGELDLATANFEGDDVTILTGDGAAAFMADPALINFDRVDLLFPSVAGVVVRHTGPTDLVAADLNDDQLPDIATANSEGGSVLIALACADVLPTITVQPTDQAVALGDSVTLNVAATGAMSPEYRWRKDGAAIAGATGATLTIPIFTGADVGDYDVVVTNGCASVTSDVATLSIAIEPPVNPIGGLCPMASLSLVGLTLAGLIRFRPRPVR